ncbi:MULTISPECIES: GntR family transcriptional regulator [Deinococcus]|uniref:GntR family transcriptional regulator n=1 Tax=Deinococcus rufus TaxID=2136097 RepID=A0ABV7Z2Q3_9DEIO|nr:GntR family transcriptional regulator [Deinococcus sp. AB2017081]WQE95891.1 GntR family transcriptional regulator [Deinococcus sp. AB2017081]
MTAPTLDTPAAFVRPLSIDRTLDVPVGAQLRGQLEYGIACGEIARGTRLPSVRELSQELGVAHVTVAQVYKELLGLGLIVTARGRGTYVADAPRVQNSPDHARLRDLLSGAIGDAQREGFTLRQISEVMGVLLARAGQPAQEGVTVLLVGLFADATRSYAADLHPALRPGDRVQTVTLGELRRGDGLEHAHAADVVLALAHRLAETQALLPGVTVIPVGFIPAQATRAALAGLSPLSTVALVATFEDFLPTFLAGVRRFAPHVLTLNATHLHAPGLQTVLEDADVVVYATGSEMVRDLVPGTAAIEYRHMIDPRDVEGLVLPAVEARRKEHHDNNSR